METINYEALEAAYNEDEVAFLQEQLRLMPFVVDFKKQREKLMRGGDEHARPSGTYARRAIADNKGAKRARVLREFAIRQRKIWQVIRQAIRGAVQVLG